MIRYGSALSQKTIKSSRMLGLLKAFGWAAVKIRESERGCKAAEKDVRSITKEILTRFGESVPTDEELDSIFGL